MTATTRTFKTLAWLLPLLAACTTAPPAPPAPAPAPVVPPPCVAASAPPSEPTRLLAYHHSLRSLGAADLARELAELNGQAASPALNIRKAMVLSQGRSTAELAAAQQLLEGVPQDEALLPLAELLGLRLAEQRRLIDSLDKQAQLGAQQLKDSQRRNEQLNEKLEALKAIERTLPAAPGAAASNGK